MKAQTEKLRKLTSEPVDEIDYARIYQRFLVSQIAETADQLRRLNDSFAAEEQDASDIEKYVRKDQALRREMDRTQALFDAVVARLDEISIIQDYQGDRATVVETALPGKQVGPSILKIGGLSVVLGSMLGLALAFWLESRDDSFAEPREVRDLVGAPILAHVPIIRGTNKVQNGAVDASIVTHHSPRSRVAESFRGIRNKLFFSSIREGIRVIQVTSPMPGDGKSTAVGNLAVAIASSGKSVIVVDGDCRRPRVHRLFGVEQANGLVEVIRGECQLEDAVVFTEVEGVTVLPAGRIPNNPAELIISSEFDEVIAKLKESFDFVIVDSPPMLAVSDGSGIAAKVDGVVLVFRLDQRSRSTGLRTKQLLDEIEANVIGLVVNGLDPKAASGGYKGYGYGNQYGRYAAGGYGYDGYGQEMTVYYEDSDEPGSNGQALLPLAEASSTDV